MAASFLQIENLTKSYGDRMLFRDVTFGVYEGDKIGIIAKNGTGKSTLLSIIAGKEDKDSGNVTFRNGLRVGYLEQTPVFAPGTTVMEACLDGDNDMCRAISQYEKALAEGDEKGLDKAIHLMDSTSAWEYEDLVKQTLSQLDINDVMAQTSTLSGGQAKRVALARVILGNPELIILDEPTNHLDLNAIHWLEGYLSQYRGAVLIVAHDRYFLDKIVTKVIELRCTKATVYSGNYTAYTQKRQAMLDTMMKQYLNQQAEIRHQEEVITKLRQFNREKSIKRAESREKQLDKIERLEKPTEEHTQMQLLFTPRIQSGNDVLSVEGLSKSFDNVPLFENINFSLKRGEHVAIIGDNGTGKTTLLKILNELIPADTGSFTLGTNVCIGYYDQEHHVLHMEKTVFEEIQDTYPHMNNTEVRNVLAAFLFTGDDVFKQIKSLSGGERGRISLAKLMLSDANFLILDEPTNHLDIDSKAILEHAVNQFEGTVLYVSHDRYFINTTAHRILDLTGQTLLNYIGNYDYYLEKKEDVEQAHQNLSSTAPTGAASAKNSLEDNVKTENKLSWQEQKEEQARLRKIKNELQKVEEEIEQLEAENKEIDTALCDSANATNSARLQELAEKKAGNDSRLEELMERWEELSDD